MKTRLGPSGRPSRAGFTLVELLIVIAIIGLLATLAFVVLSRALRDARAAIERQTLVSMRNAVESFKQDFGFLPPLVDDGIPLNNATHNPRVRDEDFLRSVTQPNSIRFSVYSFPYYCLGVLGIDEDGVDGPGVTQPQRDGSFARTGREYPARMDVSRDAARIKKNPANSTQVVMVDRWGKASTPTVGWPPVNPIRYYRWSPAFAADGTVDQFLTPRAVGDPNKDASLRDAQYALVSVGPDGQTDERKPLPRTGSVADNRTDAAPINARITADDIVEAGR